MNLFEQSQKSLFKKNGVPLTENLFEEYFGSVMSFKDWVESFSDLGGDIHKLYIFPDTFVPLWYLDTHVQYMMPINVTDVSLTKLLVKQAKLLQASQKKAWEQNKVNEYFARMDSRFVWDVFIEKLPEIPKGLQYHLLKRIYRKQDYNPSVRKNEPIWEVLSTNPNRGSFSKKELIIYRGMNDKSLGIEEAISWTTSFQTAIYFATRFDDSVGKVYKAKIKPEDILDFLPERGENEVWIDPEKLLEVEDMELHFLQDSTMKNHVENMKFDYQFQVQYGLNANWFRDPESIHGLGHTKRVLFLSLLLAEMNNLSETDRNVLLYVSIYHDIGRVNDWIDDDHGINGVRKRQSLDLPVEELEEEDIRLMEFIMEYHCLDDELGLQAIENSKDIDKERYTQLFLLFKDADGLDRWRISDLDIRYLRHDLSKKLALVSNQLLRIIE